LGKGIDSNSKENSYVKPKAKKLRRVGSLVERKSFWA